VPKPSPCTLLESLTSGLDLGFCCRLERALKLRESRGGPNATCDVDRFSFHLVHGRRTRPISSRLRHKAPRFGLLHGTQQKYILKHRLLSLPTLGRGSALGLRGSNRVFIKSSFIQHMRSWNAATAVFHTLYSVYKYVSTRVYLIVCGTREHIPIIESMNGSYFGYGEIKQGGSYRLRGANKT
jgi:hypothetical protein